MSAPLLNGLAKAGVDLVDAVITAQRTQRAHAEYLHEHGAEFVFAPRATNRRCSQRSTH